MRTLLSQEEIDAMSPSERATLACSIEAEVNEILSGSTARHDHELFFWANIMLYRLDVGLAR